MDQVLHGQLETVPSTPTFFLMNCLPWRDLKGGSKVNAIVGHILIVYTEKRWIARPVGYRAPRAAFLAS